MKGLFTMKVLTMILFMSFPFALFGQDKIIGHYRNHFGYSIQLNPDSTFEYTWHFDLSWSWTKGTWAVNKDTVYFHMVPVYDTITAEDKSNTSNEKIILSSDRTSERLTPEQIASIGLPSGGQNFMPYSEKLVYKKDRLYEVKNGRLIKRKEKVLRKRKSGIPGSLKVRNENI